MAELIPGLGLGWWIGRNWPQWTGVLAAPLVRFGVPLSVMGLLLKGGLNWNLALTALMAAIAIASWMLIVRGLPPQHRPVRSATLQIGCVLGNTAYFGIPVALALLPNQALPISIGYDLGATLLAWSLGPFWLERDKGTLRQLLGHLAASPASRGLVGAFLVQTTPWSSTVAAALWLPSRIVIVLALVVVGMRLGSLHQPTPATSTPKGELHAALVCKLLLFPAWIWLLSTLLPLPVLTRQALVLQGAAPAAISVLLMAENADRDSDHAAKLLLLSTVWALISVPLWWFLLLRPLGTLGT